MLDTSYSCYAKLNLGHIRPSDYSFNKFVVIGEFATVNVRNCVLFFSKRTKKFGLI